MNSFSISELQQFSGIKAHTIRMWEQRYHALKPNRSEGNTRYYDGHQLRRLLNIVSLMNGDHKISDLCTKSDKELFALLSDGSKSAVQPYEYFIALILASALEYDEVQFDKIFSTALLRYGLHQVYLFILYPALERLGLMWANDTLRPAHEHFITSLFRQKILTAIDSLPLSTTVKETWLLFLPPNEFHETGLLFANYLIRQSGRRVIYLGSDVPVDSLAEAAKQTSPLFLLTFLVRKNNAEADEELVSHLSKHFRDQKVYVACESSRLREIRKGKNIVALHSVQELNNVIK